MEGVELIRTPSDDLLVGLDKAVYPNPEESLALVMIKYGLPMPWAVVSKAEETQKWAAVFSVPERWWRLYLEDWTPCPDDWLEDIVQRS